MSTATNLTGSAVVGYFTAPDAARRAINALKDAGFSSSSIGAAFHVDRQESVSGSEPANTRGTEGADVGGSLREGIETTNPHPGLRPTSSFGAADSDDTAAQPNVIATGAGTGMSGGSRPGPISGSSMAHSGLPSELKSTLPHEKGFEPTDRPPLSEPLTTKESQDFGSGEGHLILGEPARRVGYSHADFENSFSGYGVESKHARYLSHQLGRQGAVVTVHDAARSEEAERILQQNGGVIRFSGDDVPPEPTTGGHVEVYGTIDKSFSR